MAGHHSTFKLSPRKLNAALTLILILDILISAGRALLKRAERLRAALRPKRRKPSQRLPGFLVVPSNRRLLIVPGTPETRLLVTPRKEFYDLPN